MRADAVFRFTPRYWAPHRLGGWTGRVGLDLGSLSTRAEAAAPVGVVDAMAAALLEMLDAHDVSFLIADFSGRSLTRLGHTVASESPSSRGARTGRRRGGSAASGLPSRRSQLTCATVSGRSR